LLAFAGCKCFRSFTKCFLARPLYDNAYHEAVIFFYFLKSGKGINDRFLKREVEILRWLNHDNVIRVYDLIEGADHFFIVMELAPKGDLLSLLRERSKLGEDEARVMFKSIVDGVLYCHRKGAYMY